MSLIEVVWRVTALQNVLLKTDLFCLRKENDLLCTVGSPSLIIGREIFSTALVKIDEFIPLSI